jgi:hypothetical protein
MSFSSRLLQPVSFLPTGVLVTIGTLAACSGSTTTATPHDDASFVGPKEAGTPEHDASTTQSTDSGSDVSSVGSPDVAPVDAPAAMRNATCTPTHAQTGTVVDTSHGRLDGTLVYVVDVGTGKTCNGDDSHVHLQIEVSGNVYDVAVDIGTAPNDEVGMYEDAIAIPDGTWAEGWHGTDALAYPSLGLHVASFPIQDPTTIATQLEALLTSTSKISIFCTGYTQGNGCHDVHYEHGNGDDGAIVLNPTAATSTVLFFRFESDMF